MNESQTRARVLIAEMLRLSRLGGNCGRVITRFVERVIRDNELEVRLDVPRRWRMLDLACFVASMNQDIERRREQQEGSTMPAPYIHVTSVFSWLSIHAVSYIVAMPDVPSTTTGRREMLRGLAETLDQVLDMQSGFLNEDAAPSLRAWFLGDDFSASEADLNVFDEAVRGLYTRLEQLSPRLMALANVLNSQVAVAAPAGISMTVVAVGAEEVQLA